MTLPPAPHQFDLEQTDLDVRTARSRHTRIAPRYIDQKVTPDVLCTVANVVLSLAPHNGYQFKVRDVMKSPVFRNDFTTIFGKPSPEDDRTNSEYDKIAGQPLKTLDFAGLLDVQRDGNSLLYTVVDAETINTIASREVQAFHFLVAYLYAVNAASGLSTLFERYFHSAHEKRDYEILKDQYIRYMKRHTNIQTDVEIRRILPKALNPLAVYWTIPGAHGGYASKENYTYADLMYNARNWRDFDKPKGMSRQEYLNRSNDLVTPDLANVQNRRLMQAIRNRHQGDSEVHDELASGKATQVHHIFPSSKYPTLRNYPENLILLTASQHNTRAHPRNRTQEIDPMYQLTCLLAKLESVRRSEDLGDGFYLYENFIDMLNDGFSLSLDASLGYEQIKRILERKIRDQP